MKTHIVAIFSDVHFKDHHVNAWKAFVEWHREHQPLLTIADGDLINLSMLSTFTANVDDPVAAAPEIKMAVREMNALKKHTKTLTLVPGNHEDRWWRGLFGTKATQLKGAKGLSLEEQFRMQGLDPAIKWQNETAASPGIVLGKNACIVFHGHKQASRFGVTNVASGLLHKFSSISTVVGHHHRAQLNCRTEWGFRKPTIAIANPHLSGKHEYNTTPSWQRGFTVLEFYGRSRMRDCEFFTPHLVIMDEKGRFAWGGKVYGA